MFFADIKGKQNVLCFRNMAKYIVNNIWSSNKMESSEEEAMRIVKTAAKIIIAEIAEMVYDVDFYPTDDVVKSMEQGRDFLPVYLLVLMNILLPCPVKQISIGQCIVKAARPRSSLPPIMFGLGIEIDHMFGSK